jgi:hypothetical protein
VAVIAQGVLELLLVPPKENNDKGPVVDIGIVYGVGPT